MGKLTEQEAKAIAAVSGLSRSEQALVPVGAAEILAFLESKAVAIDTTHANRGGFYIFREPESEAWIVETYSYTTDKLCSHDAHDSLAEAIRSVMP